MGHYSTSEELLSLNKDQVRGILAFLEERLGCFRIFAMDCNGRDLVIINEDSSMETRALDNLMSEYIDNKEDSCLFGDDENDDEEEGIV